MNVLVAYFSASGVTEKVAKKLADVTAEWRDRNGGTTLFVPFSAEQKGSSPCSGRTERKKKSRDFPAFQVSVGFFRFRLLLSLDTLLKF